VRSRKPHLFCRSGSKDDRLYERMKISVVSDEVRRTLPWSLGALSIGQYFVRKIRFSAELMVSYFYLMIALDRLLARELRHPLSHIDYDNMFGRRKFRDSAC
jgi:hypothetical protein